MLQLVAEDLPDIGQLRAQMRLRSRGRPVDEEPPTLALAVAGLDAGGPWVAGRGLPVATMAGIWYHQSGSPSPSTTELPVASSAAVTPVLRRTISSSHCTRFCRFSSWSRGTEALATWGPGGGMVQRTPARVQAEQLG